MGGFAFQVACLRLVANEPLFGVYAVPVDWPVDLPPAGGMQLERQSHPSSVEFNLS